MMAIIGTLTYEFGVILPLFARFTFHGDAGSYAALTSFMGLGAVMGGIYTASQRKGASGRALVRTAALFGAVILLAALSPTLAVATAAMIPVGAMSIAFTSQGNATLQLEAAPEMRGRVMALWTVAFMGSTPIGGPIIGAIGEHAGPRWGLATGGLAAILAAGLGALVMRSGRNRTAAATEEDAGSDGK
jgi:MFS family permease